MGDWLGTEYVANRIRKYRSFELARDFERSLNLRGQPEWHECWKSEAIPLDVLRPLGWCIRAPDGKAYEIGWVSPIRE